MDAISVQESLGNATVIEQTVVEYVKNRLMQARMPHRAHALLSPAPAASRILAPDATHRAHSLRQNAPTPARRWPHKTEARARLSSPAVPSTRPILLPRVGDRWNRLSLAVQYG